MDIAEFLEKSRNCPVVDVRSPAEFDHSHIPGAVNLPLFTNEERAVVGTLYLQKGPQDAMMKGMELVGPKMKQFAEHGLGIANGGEVLLHCWRGGMRSNSLAWLFRTIGIKASTLDGGYKAYRQFVHEFFDRPYKLVIIGGMTGSGKTDVIEEIERQGEQVIHLEKLASHKGSVFGGIGLPDQPTTGQFENDLFNQLYNQNPDRYVYIEDESIAIGSVFIPHNFFNQMSASPIVILDIPKEHRIERLVSAYVSENSPLLIEYTRRIGKHLGYHNMESIIRHIENGDFLKAVELLLVYYDKLYTRSMQLRKRSIRREIQTNADSTKILAKKIISLTDTLFQ